MSRKRIKKAPDDAPEEEQDEAPVQVLGGMSPAGFALLQQWAWGEISASTLQTLANSMVATYGKKASDVARFAALGASGHSSSHCQRDLLAGLKNLKAPSPSKVEAYVIHMKGSVAELKKEWIYYFKPSDWFTCLEEHGLAHRLLGVNDTESFWARVSPNDPKMQCNKIKAKKGYAKSVVPLLLHGDAGPHQKHDSLNVYSMQSLLRSPDASVDESMLLLAAVPQSCRATAKRCSDLRLEFVEDTWDAIGRALAEDFNKLFDKLKAVIWVATADCDHLSKDYGLPHSSADSPCMRCKCNRHSIPITDVGPNALWRKHPVSPAEVAAAPMTTHWLLSIKGFSHHSFVYDPMHCMDLGATSHAIANVFYVVFYSYLPGRTNAEKTRKLNELVKEAYDHHNVPHDQRIHWLDTKHFLDEDAPHQNYPDLQHSAIKARKTRYLVPVAFWLAEKFKDGDGYLSKTMFYCLKNLHEAYEIIDRNFLFVAEPEKPALKKCMLNFAMHYVSLAKAATKKPGRGFYTWSFVPKMHFMLHIEEDAAFLAPRAFWCYAGESMVGLITSIATSCLHGLPAHRISQTLCLKYRVAKHLQILEQED